MTGWPHFGWGWLIAVAAALIGMSLAGFLPIKAFWWRVVVAMLAFVGVYMIVLYVISLYGVGV